jgi:hypothetical protein
MKEALGVDQLRHELVATDIRSALVIEPTAFSSAVETRTHERMPS